MRKFTLSLVLLLLASYAGFAQCTSAYSSASYALAHTKKALNADNFDHQMLYADRGVAAMEKAKVLIEDCGCQSALNEIVNGLDNLSKATDPEDWKAGRFYTQIALEHMQSVMGALDRCTTGQSTIDNTPDTTSDLTASADTTTEYLAVNNADLSDEQARLEAEKRRLEEQQRMLEEKIAQQKAMAERAKMAREQELEEQLVLKRAAEIHLASMEESLKDLAESLGCQKAMALLNGSYMRSDDVLNNENLKETRNYYIQQTIRMQRDVAAALESCKNK